MSTGRAVVVGSGPNGLVGAVLLARGGYAVTVVEAGATPGGGARTAELLRPGLWHDVCSAVHPLALVSPVFADLDLGRHGLEWLWADVDLAHPLDDGTALTLTRGDDAGYPGASVDRLAEDVLGPVLHRPRHPLALARFGAEALLPAATVARRRGELFAGLAAHAMQPLTAPGTAAAGLLLGAAGQRFGWPVPRGGSAAIVDALLALLGAHGGKVETGRTVTGLAELDGADVVLLDVTPRAALRLVGDRLPAPVRRAWERFRYGPAAFKLDLAVEGGLPWTAAAARRAGTVHVGGALSDIVAAESDVARGRMPPRPFVLVAQQYLADPSRSVGDVHPIWAYAHVPAGWPGDATDAILAQLERFAPGTRGRVLDLVATPPASLASYDPNYVGGDIGSGATDLRQLVARPRLFAPYSTGVPGVFLCSASTPPGPGVHGMAGAHAAATALRSVAS